MPGDTLIRLEGRFSGHRRPSRVAIRTHADKVALSLMTSENRVDWTDWFVDVRDTKGRRVLLRAFTEVRVVG